MICVLMVTRVVLTAAWVHVRTPSVGLTRRIDSRERRQQRHQPQPSQTIDCLYNHVVTRCSTRTQWSTKGIDS